METLIVILALIYCGYKDYQTNQLIKELTKNQTENAGKIPVYYPPVGKPDGLPDTKIEDEHFIELDDVPETELRDSFKKDKK